MAHNIHWSRQFKKPRTSTNMDGGTGMSDGNGKPTIKTAKWHNGKLYMSGVWLAGLDGNNLKKRDVNVNWYMWTWNLEEGYRPICWQHSAQGGPGPRGVINDFVFLPDGRMAVGGEFLEIGNPHGHSYHRIKGMAMFDPRLPKFNNWRPFSSSVQYNGPGIVKTLAYDPKENELWVGGGFSGYRMDPLHRELFCFAVQRYCFNDQRWRIMPPGLRGGTVCNKIRIDFRTNPSTVYIAGRMSHTGGDGKPASDNGTAGYSTGFCAWRKDKGWITFPEKNPKSHDCILQRAADYAFFDSVNVFDFLIDEAGDPWIVGAFSEGKTNKDGKPLRGVARYDRNKQMWVDPTGKGGFGRDAYGITKTQDGKIYIAGAFGGEKGSDHYDGFKNGDKAHMAVCFDPKNGTWSKLGDGLGGFSMPVCKCMAIENDVIYYGTFRQVGRDPRRSGFESFYIARWNEYVDFTKGTPALPVREVEEVGEEEEDEEMGRVRGLEHWSRNFPPPPRRVGMGKSKQSGQTGMDNGCGWPDIKAMQWHEGLLYIGGSWQVYKNERWHVWTYHPQAGYVKLGWTGRGGEKGGFASIPAGLKFYGGKMYVHGANESYKGIAIYDPKNKTWSEFKGTYKGKAIKGNGAVGNPAVNDMAFDRRTGDIYLVGTCGESIRYESGHPGGTLPSQVMRVDKNMVYHPMGLMLLAQNPSKPDLCINCIYLDETKTPLDLYIGGSFGFRGAESHLKNGVYNVAKWDHNRKDWGPMGKGDFWRMGMHDRNQWPEGRPGLKGQPIYGFKSFLRDLFPRVRCLTMDKMGNLYAGGAIGILDDNPDINKRNEHYGLVKYDVKLDRWVGASNCRGVSRDVFQMTWLDETHLLVTGGFLYSEDFRLLNNIAILDIVSGELSPLSGGVHKASNAHVYSCNVIHTIDPMDGSYWFGGYFQYAGVGHTCVTQAPVESNYIAHYDPKRNLDPNGSMTAEANPRAVKGVTGFSSQPREVELKAFNIPQGGTLVWYQKGLGKNVKKLGTGPSKKVKFRVKGTDTSFTFYASVLTKDKIEGGKVPVIVKVQGV